MCDWEDDFDEQETAQKVEEMLYMAESMGQRGYRVLALAEGVLPGTLDPAHAPPEPSHLTFLGFVGMIDPLRPGVRDAVAASREAGIGACMITGDHPVTALAISRDLGLASEPHQVVTGSELAKMSPAEMEQAVKTARVFARVAPHQKLELVNAASSRTLRRSHRRWCQRCASPSGCEHWSGDGQVGNGCGSRGRRTRHQ